MKKFLILSFIFISCQNISDEIIVDTDVEDMYLRYNKAWSEGDFEPSPMKSTVHHSLFTFKILQLF